MSQLYVVTGGAGFIGSHLATALVKRGDRVRIVDDLSSGKLANLNHLEIGADGSGSQIEFLEGDVTQPRICELACRDAHGVFHEAAQVSVPQSLEDPERSYEVNVMSTLRLLMAAQAQGVQKFTFAASAAAYGNDPDLPKRESMPVAPESPYASGKIASEHLLRVWGSAHGVSTVALRYFNVFGPRQADDSPYTGVIAIFARRLIQGEPVTIFGDGEQTRDFVFVDDIVQANLLSMDRELPPGSVINVGSGQSVSVNQLYTAMAQILGVDRKPAYGPERPGDVKHSLPDIGRASSLLGYLPQVAFNAGLATTLEWYKERYHG